ncbi:MAG: hypothetical protein LLF95_05775 [Bacteroidales bacterium]|nr:hypothetical protein [Bacteroidales bacterium]
MNTCFKYFPFLLGLILAFAACNKPANENSSDNDSNTYHFNDTLLINQENPKITEYRAFVDQLDSMDAASAVKASEQFKALFANQSTGLCDTAFVIFQHLMDALELNLNEKLRNDTTDYSVLFTGEPVSKKMKDFQISLQKNGFKFSTSDGMYYIEQYRPFTIQNLSFMLSEPMKLYLSEIETENREGFAENASIVISPNQHVDRIIWYENFIKSNPKFVLLENCKNYRKAYLTYLLTGFDNTPLYSNKEIMEISAYFVTAYKYLIKTYPDSETASYVTPYYDAIQQKQTATVKDILKKYVIKGLIYNLE